MSPAKADCTTPRYSTIRDFINPRIDKEGALHISIQPDDFTVDRLRCLTEPSIQQGQDVVQFALPDRINPGRLALTAERANP